MTMLIACRDCIVYSSHCSKLDGRKVAVKVYEKSSLSASKLRAVKREAAMMIYMTRKRCGLCSASNLHPLRKCTHFSVVLLAASCLQWDNAMQWPKPDGIVKRYG